MKNVFKKKWSIWGPSLGPRFARTERSSEIKSLSSWMRVIPLCWWGGGAVSWAACLVSWGSTLIKDSPEIPTMRYMILSRMVPVNYPFSLSNRNSSFSEVTSAIFKNIYLFIIYFWLCWVFVATCGLLSSCGAWAPELEGSVVAACGLSCPAACGILVPWPGIEPASPLEGGFLTTGPPGKSPLLLFGGLVGQSM